MSLLVQEFSPFMPHFSQKKRNYQGATAGLVLTRRRRVGHSGRPHGARQQRYCSCSSIDLFRCVARELLHWNLFHCILLHNFFHVLHIFLHIVSYFNSGTQLWYQLAWQTSRDNRQPMYISLQNRFTFARQDFFELLIGQSINSSRYKDDQMITEEEKYN